MVRFLYCIAISLFWGALGWEMGDSFLLGVLFFGGSIALHWPAIK
jgi:hypothetical protein